MRICGEIVRCKKNANYVFIQPEGTSKKEDRVYAKKQNFDSNTEILRTGTHVEYELQESEKIPGTFEAVNVKVTGGEIRSIDEKISEQILEQTKTNITKSTKKRKNQLPFSTTTFSNKDWRSISKIIKKNTGCESPKEYWEDTASLLIENFEFAENPIMDGEKFQGFFVKLSGGRTVDGWQGFIWCEKFNGLVLIRQNHGRIDGSIGSSGEQVEFQVTIGSDPNGNPQFTAHNWSSSFKRHFSEPAYSVTAEEYASHKSSISEYIQEKAGPVVIVALPTLSSHQNTLLKNLSVELQENYAVTHTDWPKRVNPTIPKYSLDSQTKEENSHPYVGEFIANSIVLRHLDFKDIPLTPEEEKHIILGITKQAHISQIKKRKKNWLILGDETGSLAEYKGVTLHRPSRMMWVAIPPDVELPILSPEFHGQDFEQFNAELNDALKELESNKKIKKFVFTYESGELPSQLKEEKSNSPHLMMWNNTLPLVIERLLPSIGGDNIEVFIERVDPLPPGSRPLAAPIQDIVNNLSKRPEGVSIKFIDHRILSKNPLEHGWLGYTDAIGHIYNDEIPEHMVETISNLQNQCISTPYRQDGVESIRSLISKAPKPLQFLTALSEIEVRNQEDYIDNFLKGTVANSLTNLKPGQWQELLSHLKFTAKNYQGQQASRRILSLVEINPILTKLRGDNDRFDLLMAILGTAGHIGATDQAIDCIRRIENMFSHGLKINSDRRFDFSNLKGGTLNNLFDFGHIHPIEFPDDITSISESFQHYIGSQSVARALRDDSTSNDWEEAWDLEEKLLDISTNEQSLKRRWLYRVELAMGRGRFAESLQELEDLPKVASLSDSFDVLCSDSYFLATLLKSSAMADADLNKFSKYSTTIDATLTSQHPSQRIAYWCVRWAHTIDQTSSPIVGKCCEHLINLMNEPVFTHDAAGVMLACELLDLKYRGLVDVDADSFMEQVLSNSAKSTREWVAAHPPNVDDWLAPLNFNYR